MDAHYEYKNEVPGCYILELQEIKFKNIKKENMAFNWTSS